MAKEEKLSLEELLEQALVKDEDKPYAVPGNWVWTRLGDITIITGGGTPQSNVTEYYNGGDIAWITPADLSGYNDMYISKGERNITKLGLEQSSAKLMPRDTVLLSSRAPIGYVAIALEQLCTNQGFKSFWPSPIYKPQYLYYYLMQNKKLLETYASGTTFLELSRKKVSQIPFPLPPLPEQQRIVDIIESLFEKLDRAKELAQHALDSFEKRKSAILHKAFTGELIRKWREENGLSFEKWQKYTVKDLVMNLNQGWSPKCENFPSIDYDKWGVIKTTAIQHMEFVEEENKQLPSSLEPREKHELKAGDILITRAGPRIRVGVCCLVKQVRPRLLLCDKAYRFRVNEKLVMPEYIVFALNTPSMLDEINLMKTGISDSGVNLTQNGFQGLKLNIPPLAEQKEIVRILDNLLANEQKAKELCNVIDKIDHMKKAILARAFRGELGTNNPDEESALELLKEVLKEKI
ncbi:Restriction modification system DNA specificity domain [uncultured Sporomusa sp.]|uniref:Restriction modification system DNA specificity domain n=1 Tax=uncultured Sporomusa sp. TaxID=307249 RepID=A0A212LZF0_9FIRM|nr:restriction endonuclease subunit S [uncultured Sporomusa sp.]SCM82901.1 Restriction modification system DNA specificity domain [uncultured Sporomusa sp.]